MFKQKKTITTVSFGACGAVKRLWLDRVSVLRVFVSLSVLFAAACSGPIGLFNRAKPSAQCSSLPTCGPRAGATSVRPAVVVTKSGSYIPPPPKLSFGQEFAPPASLLPQAATAKEKASWAGAGTSVAPKNTAASEWPNIRPSPRGAVVKEELFSSGASAASPDRGLDSSSVQLLLGSVNDLPNELDRTKTGALGREAASRVSRQHGAQQRSSRQRAISGDAASLPGHAAKSSVPDVIRPAGFNPTTQESQ
jgi:hypothetical protein